MPQHMQRLLEQLRGLQALMVLVCRPMDGDYARYLQSFGRVLMRDPDGDARFGSYQAGIESLGDLSAYTRLLLLDSSFIAFNPADLCARAMSPPAGLDVVGLTMVHAPEACLQSYWLSFEGSQVLRSAAFRAWWAGKRIRGDRAMTRHFTESGFSVGAMFRPDRAESIVAACRALACGAMSLTVPDDGPYMLDPSLALHSDPAVFAWDALFAEFGVLVLELLRSVPHGVNITALRKWIANTPGAAALVDEALRSQLA